MEVPPKTIRIQVRNTDALTCKADVLVLKYAQELYGLDRLVVNLLEHAGIKTTSYLPEEGGHYFVNSMNQIGPSSVLFVGVKPLFYFRYQEIRDFAHRAFAILAEKAPETKHVCLTLHGANFGLDEIEAFESEIAGLVDAFNVDSFPAKLELVTIVERKESRAEQLQNVLSQLLPGGCYERHADKLKEQKPRATNERLRSAGYASDSKPHVFVAMPFSEDMEDVYDYGIKRAVNGAGFICERADLSAFTGDILERVKSRIKTAALVVAELTGANPNVYLEVGYAWGCGVPTMLVVRDAKELKFDVQGQRCLSYKRIKELEELLQRELQGLREALPGEEFTRHSEEFRRGAQS